MSYTPTFARSPFALPDSRSRRPLTLARWLAIGEGIILLFGAYMMMASGAAKQSPAVAAIAAVFALLSLTLGWNVGRGSAPAAMILLGLSISRGVATALPGAPEWWTSSPKLTLVELIIFGLAVRAARAADQVERPASTRTNPGVRDRGIGDLRQEENASARGFRMDVAIGGAVAVLSMMAMAIDVPAHNEGLQGFGESLIVGLGVLDFLLAIVLLAAGAAARKGSAWGSRIRAAAYMLIGTQALFAVRILIASAIAPIRR